MGVAALYDIHGNLPALQAVLADVAREETSTGGFPDQDEMLRRACSPRCPGRGGGVLRA
jgi:hypothetical protein